jgi:hypothetical protein
MIVFKNKGLIDINAVTTMGVSVKNPFSFGFFGTGVKFSIATILRNGGEIRIHRGLDCFRFNTKPMEIRGQMFNLVQMEEDLGDGSIVTPLGFTDQLGKNWESWMVFRELGCNAKDEPEGDFYQIEDENDWSIDYQPDTTTVVVRWDEMDEVFRNKDEIFCAGNALTTVQDRLRVLPGMSSHLFYRGVRVFKLEKASRYRYDLISDQRLTEDRSLYSSYGAMAEIRRFWRSCEDKGLLAGALLDCKDLMEGQIDYETEYGDVPLSKAFVDVVLAAKDRKEKDINKSALEAVMSQARKQIETNHFKTVRDERGPVARAIALLESLDMDFDADVVIVDELPGDRMSLTENGRIFVRDALVKGPSMKLADHLLRRFLELKHYTSDSVTDFLVPLLMNRIPRSIMTAEEVATDMDEDLVI